MAGIGGIFHIDGAPVEPSTVAVMGERLRHRGIRTKSRNIGPVGLFCRFSGSVADAFFCNRRTVVAAHCRLDNRQELVGRLGLSPSAGDAALLGAAYERWGVTSPDHLVGDFAFALWDAAAQQLFCARDLFGVRPFYFHHDAGRGFFFGSEIKALLASGRVPKDVNDERVADYLAGVCAREDYTFYDKIWRLPSAHALIADRSGVRMWRYGSISADSRQPTHAADAFRERFDEAVRCRTQGCSDVAVTLSGGLDSSSIAMAASDLGRRVHTFSALFDACPECDESSYISDVVHRIRCTAHYVPGGLQPGDALTELKQVLALQDEPVSAPNAYLPWRLYRTIGSKGLDVALDGHGGDEVVSQGTGALKELAAARNWAQLGRELRALSGAYAQPFLPLWLGYVSYGLQRREGRFSAFGSKVTRRLYRLMNRGANGVSVVGADLAERTRLHDRLRARPDPAEAGTERERHRLLVDSPERAYGFEVLDRIAHAFSVEPRYPFWDARLVRLCLALPADQKLKNGYGRLVLRHAMAGRLPDSIRWRRTKANFLPNLIQGLTDDESKVRGCILTCSPNMEAYVDAAAVELACHKITAGDASLEDVASVIRVTLLHSWLEGHDRRAGDADGCHTMAKASAS